LWFVELPFVGSHEKEAGASYEVLCDNFFEEILAAEKYGFEEVMASEHHFSQNWWPSPVLVALAAGLKTTRIKVGTSIALVPLYNPVRLAEDVATADVLSGGRFILGVGQGYRPEEFGAFNAHLDSRGNRTEEGVNLIRKLWAEQHVSFTSKYWPGVGLKDATLVPKPVQKPRPPIWVGAWVSEKSARRAARIVASGGGIDKWLPETLYPFESLDILVSAYKDELRKHDAEYNAATEPVFLNEGYITTDETAAWEQAKPYLMKSYADYYDWSHFPPDITGKTTERDRDYTKTMKLDEIVTREVKPRMILGTPDACISQLERLEKRFGMHHTVIEFHLHGLSHKTMLEQLRLFGQKVIPYFADRDRK
jgi:alkanesulfonate monooxygenase SsuD/methylene tetrahydromethanopterin reductase-like flavin-dependent oxidoreductase (luciferase family)